MMIMKKKQQQNVVNKPKKRRIMVAQLTMNCRTSSILSILHITILREVVVFINAYKWWRSILIIMVVK
jgi:hypothetical protein